MMMMMIIIRIQMIVNFMFSSCFCCVLISESSLHKCTTEVFIYVVGLIWRHLERGLYRSEPWRTVYGTVYGKHFTV